jgi:hypothetical protein
MKVALKAAETAVASLRRARLGGHCHVVDPAGLVIVQLRGDHAHQKDRLGATARVRLSARYRFSQGTFAGTRGNGREAPGPPFGRPVANGLSRLKLVLHPA